MKSFSTWLTHRVFSFVHGNYLVYNTCWEDPRLDREVMQLGPEEDVVLITSAGCNALDYVLDNPRSVHAVDLNFRQNALLELKKAGIRHLEFEDFFKLFGEGGDPRFDHWYHTRLREELSPAAQGYWDACIHFLNGSQPSESFYRRGTTGAFGKLLVDYCKLKGVYEDALEVFRTDSQEKRRALYFEKIKDRFWSGGIKRALRTDAALALIGVPLAQRNHLEETCAQSVTDFMENAMEAVFTKIPTLDNYFWRLYLCGRYSRECCPEYLKEENFNRLKAGLIDKVHTHTSDLTSFLQSHPESFSRFVLLDHMDWLSQQAPQALSAEWQAIVDKARPNAQVLWRSGGARVEFVDPLSVQRQGKACKVGDFLQYDTALAADCHQRDRVHTYGSFYIARITA